MKRVCVCVCARARVCWMFTIRCVGCEQPMATLCGEPTATATLLSQSESSYKTWLIWLNACVSQPHDMHTHIAVYNLTEGNTIH